MNKRNAGREKAKRERDPRRREKTEMRAAQAPRFLQRRLRLRSSSRAPSTSHSGWTTTVSSPCGHHRHFPGSSYPPWDPTREGRGSDEPHSTSVPEAVRKGGTGALGLESSLLQRLSRKWVPYVRCVWRWHAWGSLWLFADSTMRPERPLKEHPEAEATVGWRAISESMKC